MAEKKYKVVDTEKGRRILINGVEHEYTTTERNGEKIVYVYPTYEEQIRGQQVYEIQQTQIYEGEDEEE